MLRVGFYFREGLTDVTVIVKGLGSGFHQPVDEQHSLNLVSVSCSVNNLTKEIENTFYSI